MIDFQVNPPGSGLPAEKACRHRAAESADGPVMYAFETKTVQIRTLFQKVIL